MDLVDIALLFHGTRYSFGGNGIETGIDCSGLVCESLRSIGLLDKRDLTAQGIFDYFESLHKQGRGFRNRMLFFGKSVTKITHTSIAMDWELMIEAGGEGSIETDKGYVRIRPISNRRDLVAYINL